MEFSLEQLKTPERWIELALPVGVKILVALLIFYLGRFVVRTAVKVLRTVMQRSKADETLTGFLGNVAYGLGYALVIIPRSARSASTPIRWRRSSVAPRWQWAWRCRTSCRRLQPACC